MSQQILDKNYKSELENQITQILISKLKRTPKNSSNNYKPIKENFSISDKYDINNLAFSRSIVLGKQRRRIIDEKWHL